MKTEPTEALANQAIKKITDSLMFEINYEEDNYDAGYSAALHNHGEALYMMGFLKGQSNPKIRQLEWEEYENLRGRKSYFAKTTFSPYEVADGGDHYTMFSPDKRLRFASADAAKSAAQADFEKRVNECLE